MGDTWTLEFKNKELYAAQARQNLFHDSEADETLYGGQAGGGKTQAIVADSIGNAQAFPGITIGVFRRTYPELEKSLVPKYLRTMAFGTYKYNSTKHTIVFRNGSQIELNFCENESDVYRYQSVEYDLEYFDELTHFTEFQYTYLLSRLRTTRKDFKPRVKSATNPGNIGNTWVKNRFILGGKPEEILHRHDPETGRTFSTCFIPASVYDNAYIMENDPAYIQRLLGLPEKERLALLEGNWDVFSGQAFGELRRDVHIVQAFEIPKHWKRFGAFDHGFNHPFSFGVYVVNDDGIVYRVAKSKARLKRPDEQVRLMVNACEIVGGIDKLEYIVAGHDCWARGRTGEPSLEEQFRHIPDQFPDLPKVVLRKANIDRVQGASQVRHFIAWKNITKGDDGNYIDGKPQFYFFDTAAEAYDTCVGMIFDPDHAEDVLKVDADENGKGGDDEYDEVRYALMSRPKPLPKVIRKAPQNTFQYYLQKKQEERRLRGEYVGY